MASMVPLQGPPIAVSVVFWQGAPVVEPGLASALWNFSGGRWLCPLVGWVLAFAGVKSVLLRATLPWPLAPYGCSVTAALF